MTLHRQNEFVCDIGTLFGGHKSGESIHSTNPGTNLFRLSQDQWSTHCAIIGPTGQGKSRLIWQMLREHRRQRRGFCLIDVGDLAKDFLADCAAEVLLHGNHALLSKLHYVRLGYERLPRYDALKFRPPELLHPELQQGAFVCWRHTRVKELMRVCQANTTGSVDFLNQPRAQRVLSNVFTALATEVNRKRLAFEDVFIFFDPTHPFHKRALDRVAMLLPPEIRRELEMIGGFKRMQDLRQEIESSENRLRMVLGPCMKAMLSATGTEECLDLEKVIDQGGYLIVDAQQSRFVSHEENVALASLVALDYVEANLNRPRRKRRFSTLFVDETPELLAPLGTEIGRWLRILRKYGVACCLSFQDLQSLKREDLDLAPTVLAQCGTIITFRTRWPSDTETLSRVLLTGNLDFTPLIHEVERHAGHQFLRIDEVSESVKQDVGNSTTDGETTTNATSQSRNEGESRHTTTSHGGTKNVTTGSHGEKLTSAEGSSSSLGSGLGRSTGLTHGTTQTLGVSHSRTSNETNGWSISVKHGIVPLPVVVREAQTTGKLQVSALDQQAQQQQLLHGLEQRHAVVLTSGMKKAIQIVTTDVHDPFESATAQAKGVEWIVRELQERHAYFFTPSFDPADQQERLEKTLKEEPSEEIERESAAESRSSRGVRMKLDAPAGKEIPFPE